VSGTIYRKISLEFSLSAMYVSMYVSNGWVNLRMLVGANLLSCPAPPTERDLT
jgi:hypothetical protein